MRKAVKAEAQRLIGDFGPEAYAKALAAQRLARRKHNKRLADFLAEVVGQIARDGTLSIGQRDKEQED